MTASTSIRKVLNSSQLKVDRPIAAIAFVEYSYKRTRCFAKTLNKGRRSFIFAYFLASRGSFPGVAKTPGKEPSRELAYI